MNASIPATPTIGSAPSVVQGLVYGVVSSMMMWVAIGIALYELA